MISNSTGMDIFDRGFEPMCYCVQDYNNFSNETAAKTRTIYSKSLSDRIFEKKLFFSCWHIRRSDLLTLGGR